VRRSFLNAFNYAQYGIAYSNGERVVNDLERPETAVLISGTGRLSTFGGLFCKQSLRLSISAAGFFGRLSGSFRGFLYCGLSQTAQLHKCLYPPLRWTVPSTASIFDLIPWIEPRSGFGLHLLLNWACWELLNIYIGRRKRFSSIQRSGR